MYTVKQWRWLYLVQLERAKTADREQAGVVRNMGKVAAMPCIFVVNGEWKWYHQESKLDWTEKCIYKIIVWKEWWNIW